jgi:homoaconitase/3-isopropylmalate dehydratase large subunit
MATLFHDILATMQGTIFQKILNHHGIEIISTGDVIEVPIDSLFIQDSSAMPVFESLNHHKWEIDLSNKYLTLSNYYTRQNSGKKELQRELIDLANKRGFKIIENFKGIWNHLIFKKRLISAGSIVISRGSTANFFAPFNNLNICAGKSDIIQALIKGTFSLQIPKLVQIVLNGVLQDNVSSKDLALFLIQTLEKELPPDHYIFEFKGPSLQHMTPLEIAALSLHNLQMNSYSFLFPPSKKQQKYGDSGFEADDDAEYNNTFAFDLSKIEPMLQHKNKISPLSEYIGNKIDKVYIGSTLGGTAKALEYLALRVTGKKVMIPCFVSPATVDDYLKALKKGHIEAIIKSGCILISPSPSTCTSMSGFSPYGGDTVCATIIKSSSIEKNVKSANVFISSLETATQVALTGKFGKEKKENGKK